MPLSLRVPRLSPESRAPRLPMPRLLRIVPLGERPRNMAARWERCGDPSCLGWIHANPDEHDCQSGEVQRCDECERFDCDASAHLAHARECGCGWGSLQCGHPERAPHDAGSTICAECYAACLEAARTQRSSPAAPTRGPSCEPCGGLERIGDAECRDCRPIAREG